MVAGVSDDEGAGSDLAGLAGHALDPATQRARGSQTGRWSALPSAGIALDSWQSLGHARGLRGAPTPGFLVELDADSSEASCRGLVPGAEGSPLYCPEVRGFDEALRAAEEGSHAPMRLALACVDADAAAWLEAWSEDEETVERTVRVARLADGASLTVVATLAVFGRGVDTALAVSSLAPDGRSRAGRPPLDSGVYVTVR
jgi:hypothetical protein